MHINVIKGTSKKGREYEAIKVHIGVYETMLFPSPAEMAYIKTYLGEEARKDFAGDDLLDVASE